MSPEDSLNIISRMMLQTRKSVLRSAYYLFLVWGWTTVLASITVYVLLTLTHNPKCNLIWLAIPVIGTAGVKISGHREKLVSTSLTTMLSRIWTMFMVLLVTFSLLSFFMTFKALFIILLLLSIASFTTGTMIQYPLLQYGSCAGFLLTPAIWLIDSNRQILIFAIAIMLMMIYPGYKMKQDINHERT